MEKSSVSAFDVVLKEGVSTLSVDRNSKVLKITWHGRLNLDSTSKILNRGIEFIENGACDKILLNRIHLEEFTKDANDWIKQDILKARGKSLVHKVEKVATVKSTTTMGNLFATVASSAIKIVYPNLNMRNFDSEENAIDWLLV